MRFSVVLMGTFALGTIAAPYPQTDDATYHLVKVKRNPNPLPEPVIADKATRTVTAAKRCTTCGLDAEADAAYVIVKERDPVAQSLPREEPSKTWSAAKRCTTCGFDAEADAAYVIVKEREPAPMPDHVIRDEPTRTFTAAKRCNTCGFDAEADAAYVIAKGRRGIEEAFYDLVMKRAPMPDPDPLLLEEPSKTLSAAKRCTTCGLDAEADAAYIIVRE